MPDKIRNFEGLQQLKTANSSQDKTLDSEFLACYQYVRQYVQARVISKTDVEDIVQQTFLRLMKKKAPDDARTYAFAVARSVICAYRKKKARQPMNNSYNLLERITDDSSSRTGNGIRASSEEVREAVLAAGARLSELQLEAIRLRFIEGLPTREAVRKADCSEHAYRKRLQRALGILRERLKEP